MVVALVLKNGGDFLPDHVALLCQQLRGEKIVCLSDSEAIPRQCGFIPLRYDLAGWWSKLELFSDNFADGERVVYFDLDTVIIRRPDELFRSDAPFIGLRDLWNPNQFASGVMAWTVGARSRAIWQAWKNGEKGRHDGEFIGRMLGDDWVAAQDIQPGVVSFKPRPRDHHHWRRTLDGSESIVCFHGQPRPWDVRREIEWLDKIYSIG